MNIALCYESVLPQRGGCETYICDLARRLIQEGHTVHLYACRWDEQRLPAGISYHRLDPVRGPRFLRPWRFAQQCEEQLRLSKHDISMGFNKTWGQDVLYPQGGLHIASADQNLAKFRNPRVRALVRFAKNFDLAHRSFLKLEQRQYLGEKRPFIIVNSHMVRRHFEQYYGIQPSNVHVVRSAIDPNRFCNDDRPKRRIEWRQRWQIGPHETVGLFAAMNYRLKGLAPLLRAVRRLMDTVEYRQLASSFRLVVTGHSNYKKFRNLAVRLGIADKVTFIGYCAEMDCAYFGSDFLIHPTFYDPCSLVVLEALACSLPVITTRANGASELLHPLQEGYVIDDPHDEHHLAWTIAQLLDPQRRQHCARFARRAATQWTFDHHFQALLRVLQQAAGCRHAA